MRQFSEILIPQMMVYEQKVFSLAGKNGSLKDVNNELLKSLGRSADSLPVPPYRQLRVLNLLYVFFVFSFEFWKRKGREEDLLNEISAGLITNDGFRRNKVDDISKTIKELRHSIAHADFEFVGIVAMRFWHTNSNGNKKRELNFSLDELMEILDVFSKVYISWGNNPQNYESNTSTNKGECDDHSH